MTDTNFMLALMMKMAPFSTAGDLETFVQQNS